MAYCDHCQKTVLFRCNSADKASTCRNKRPNDESASTASSGGFFDSVSDFFSSIGDSDSGGCDFGDGGGFD